MFPPTAIASLVPFPITTAVECSLTSEQVAERYRGGNAEAYESTKLVICKQSEVLRELQQELARAEAEAQAGVEGEAEVGTDADSDTQSKTSLKGIPLRKFPIAVESIVGGSGVAAAAAGGERDEEGSIWPSDRLAPASVGVLLLWARGMKRGSKTGSER